MSGPAHPIQVVVREPSLERRRLTVLFRLVLAIPHLIWLSAWSTAAAILLVVAWLVTLVRGELPEGLHQLYAMLVRYATQVYAYVSLTADGYPGFLGAPGRYAIDVRIAPPAPQRRWTVAVRILLAVPALLLTSALVGLGRASSAVVLCAVALLAWFACLARGRMPAGFRDLMGWCLGYAAQTYGYVCLLTDRFPDSTPALAGPAPAPPHPVRARLNDDDLRRSRLTVAFRALLALPHLVFLVAWGVVAYVAAVVNWLATLALGRSPAPLHRFLRAYLRYAAQVNAFLWLAANPFPPFAAGPGYPLELEVDPPERQARAVTLFRIVLAAPVLIVASALTVVRRLAGMGGWVAALLTGRMPRGLRDVIAFSIRYAAQRDAYLFLLTDRYPYSGPTLEHAPAGEWPPPGPVMPPRDWLDAPEALER